jgi:cyanophycinase-like exopeptidase
MIHYCSIPQELIYYNEKDYAKQSVIDMNGVSLVVEQVGGDQCRIVRLLSTDPNHYLDSKLSPGQMLTLKPQI